VRGCCLMVMMTECCPLSHLPQGLRSVQCTVFVDSVQLIPCVTQCLWITGLWAGDHRTG
jgi:hypothetical protein